MENLSLILAKNYTKESLIGQGAIKGEKGDSVYDIAKSQGFNGTKQEWLESLKGEKGDKGEKGERGQQGLQGQSAYRIALFSGFNGTEQEWLESLKGKNATTQYSTNETIIGNWIDGKPIYRKVITELNHITVASSNTWTKIDNTIIENLETVIDVKLKNNTNHNNIFYYGAINPTPTGIYYKNISLADNLIDTVIIDYTKSTD